MADTKPKSFRIDDETAEKFKNIAQSLGANQQGALARLIQSYELEQSKSTMPGHANQIDDFQLYTGALVDLYMGSLQVNQDLKNTIHADYASQLQAKDRIIIQLQEQVKQTDEISARLEIAQRDIARLTAELADKSKTVEILEGNQRLTSSVEELLKRLKPHQNS